MWWQQPMGQRLLLAGTGTALCAVLALVAGGCDNAGPESQAGTAKDHYHGWAAHRLAHEDAYAVMVPGISRVMAFGPRPEVNLFWENSDLAGQPANLSDGPWRNFGGAKVWVAPQKAWGWPPDRVMDQGALTIRSGASPMAATFEGPASEAMGVRLDRSLALRPGAPVMDLEYRMVATGPEAVEWGIWSVLQVKGGGTIVLPVPEGTHLWDDAEGKHLAAWQRDGDVISMTHDGTEMKVFTISREGWLAYAIADSVLVLSFEGDREAHYPVEEGSAEVYCGGAYVEIEHVGPLVSLQPGESSTLTESWHVLPRRPGDDNPVDLAERVRAYLVAE